MPSGIKCTTLFYVVVVLTVLKEPILTTLVQPDLVNILRNAFRIQIHEAYLCRSCIDSFEGSEISNIIRGRLCKSENLQKSY